MDRGESFRRSSQLFPSFQAESAASMTAAALSGSALYSGPLPQPTRSAGARRSQVNCLIASLVVGIGTVPFGGEV